MSKKRRKNDIEVKNMNYRGDTILERFKNFLEDYNDNPSPSDIVGFISCENARFLCYRYNNLDNIPETIQEDIYEFYNYFLDYYDAYTYTARMENWGAEPLIMRVGQEIDDMKENEDRDKYIQNCPKVLHENAKDLADRLMNIRKDKYMTVIYSEEEKIPYKIPKIIPKENLLNIKNDVLAICIQMIVEGGAMVVSYAKNSYEAETFAIGSNGINWISVPKEELEDARDEDFENSFDSSITYTDIFHAGTSNVKMNNKKNKGKSNKLNKPSSVNEKIDFKMLN
jgi:hypothetical protein